MLIHKMGLTFTLFCCCLLVKAQSWQPVQGKLLTAWADKVNVQQPLPEYPRPQLKRSQWQNLNGLWQYVLTPSTQVDIPQNFSGNILVPYPLESALSGVGKTMNKDQALWYRKEIEVVKPEKENQLLLHFGAVDWRCEVFVNGVKIGLHEGGFDPFSFNITTSLKKGKKQEILVRVWDPTDEGSQPRGKQVAKPHGIWYTPVSGIWQTVWLEEVPPTFISTSRQTPDVDAGQVKVSADATNSKMGDLVKFEAYDGVSKMGEIILPVGMEGEIKIANPKLWSPASPKLYTLKMFLFREGKQLDAVESYFALRKIGLQKDVQGIYRLALNNKILFQYGPLDQGWWPDGLYTAPTDEALKFDILKTKELGFNMIRKHIKLEPARWYYYCDSIGMMVWQDMPSGDLGGNHWDMNPGKISGNKLEKNRTEQSEAYYRKEWKAMIDAVYNFPSIVMWVPFNEAWGQFKTKEIATWTAEYDPSRLVNSASGGNYFYTGDILDIHNYPDPAMPDLAIFGNKGQALVLGEFGGLGLPVEGHTWQDKNNWGYQSFKNKEELLSRYAQLITDLKSLIPLGLSAAVYTQTTDVEIETNGIMTYDRKVIKMPEARLKQLHQDLYK
ncbi:MAG TPA: glycoside hydrolase family 2 TIM barrel-domain containing protein [Niabella sp.]|nr:glycoside hydrolase family 2 TIM barrel-domain containing protein [Niabella sp.]HOZ97281.1 glycoside hydrolase family 2 TIM barrel-domain containing protein [Niabella sp.]HQW15448.1 glycoside hydrolase family 2 TIM barrel-domain containing protein [Niabella sp.]HQX20506.1 glycoside hydrolase family 2 TIM barrel-domain containing protein [Niabella sp.]HQX41717.1 glycoside hydrolase family 2 TIM barrel-domain containing protein [Niabella sp.]